MPGEMHELTLAIGELRGEVTALTRAQERDTACAEQHRRDMRDVVTALSQSVRTLATEVGDMRPLVSDYRDRREQAKGAAASIKWIWAAIGALGALGAAAGSSLFEIGKWFRPHP